MTHTPGPLRVKPSSNKLPGDYSLLDESGAVIAETYRHCDYYDGRSVKYDDVRLAHANANLFAAAPDLLAACESMLEAICAGAESWMLVDVEERCRAAIASVIGEGEHKDQ